MYKVYLLPQEVGLKYRLVPCWCTNCYGYIFFKIDKKKASY